MTAIQFAKYLPFLFLFAGLVFRFGRIFGSNLIFGILNSALSPFIGLYIVFHLAPAAKMLPSLPLNWQRDTFVSYLACFLVADLSFYVSHRISHWLTPLWRVHRFHHSATEMNVSVNYRHSLWSIIPNAVVITLMARVFNFQVPSLILFFGIVSIYQVYLHAERVPFPKIFEVVLLSPRVHQIHHTAENYNSNFGGVLNLWDKIFRTYHPAESHMKLEFGIRDGPGNERLIQQWLCPDLIWPQHQVNYLPQPASPPASPESPQEPAPSVPQPSPPAPASRIERSGSPSNS